MPSNERNDSDLGAVDERIEVDSIKIRIENMRDQLVCNVNRTVLRSVLYVE
jgi:hypothetical protein